MEKRQNKMKNLENGNLPMELILCCFETKKGIYLLGYVIFSNLINNFAVRPYGRDSMIKIDEFKAYQEILNERGGYLFIGDEKTKAG